MDHALLRAWLDLPPGPWPPNHYAILGLEVGQCDPAEVEMLVLARMDRLRVHQLLQPDLVTEGMNRLAQALICLTDPVARATHDAELLPETPQDEPLPDTYGLLPEQPPHPSRLEVPAAVIEPIPLPPQEWPPTSQREQLARLAFLRRLLVAWRKLQPVLTEPEESPTRPASMLMFLEAHAELQSLLDQLESLVAHCGGVGTQVVLLLRQPLPLPTFRTLRLEDRESLSRDWRRAEQAFTREQEQLRNRLLDERRLRHEAGHIRKLIRQFMNTPEVLLLVLAFASVCVAVARWQREP